MILYSILSPSSIQSANLTIVIFYLLSFIPLKERTWHDCENSTDATDDFSALIVAQIITISELIAVFEIGELLLKKHQSLRQKLQ